MAQNVVVLGLQWGDEGKGKIVDLLSREARVVVRFQGGHNAGHTLMVAQQKTILRLVPSGILQPNVACYIGNGVVVALPPLFAEINELKTKNIDVTQRLRISPACPLLLPYHIALDKAREEANGQSAIGTTGRGIGPCYEDKISRRGLRLADLLDEAVFLERLEHALNYHNFVLKNYFKVNTLSFDEVRDECFSYRDALIPMLVDVPAYLAEHHARGEKILFEGAQGMLLDIDHGTYPFVTSSNTAIGSVTNGSGFGVRHINYVLGVAKAYTTRVGGGPFPTELKDDLGKEMAQKGNEFGSVTGRPRRCGWLDLVALQRANLVNSVNALCITKLDVLDEFSEIKICTGYQISDQNQVVSDVSLQNNYFPYQQSQWKNAKPIYETLPGWEQKTADITNFSDLPRAAQAFIERIETLTKIPVAMIATGADRKQIIMREHPFEA